MRPRYLCLATVAVAVMPLAGAPVLAQASIQPPTSPAASSTSVRTVTPMKIVMVLRVVDAVPDRFGKVKILLANGAIISISAKAEAGVMRRAALDARVSPYNRISGDCGSSYIYVNHKSNGRPVHMDTGFDIFGQAVEYSWHAGIQGFLGSGYYYDYHASGNLNFVTGWHGQHSSSADYPSGVYGALVHTSDSWARLSNFSMCFSAGPSDSRTL